MRVLFAVQRGPAAPGPRYRVFQYLPHFAAAGIEYEILAMQGAASTRRSINSAHAGPLGRLLHGAQQFVQSQVIAAKLLRRASGFDRLYLYRVPLPEWAARRLRRQRSRILFDLDDAWDAPEGEASALQRLRRRVLQRGFERAVSVSSTVVVSNERNAEAVRRMGGHAEVVPTTVDLERAIYRDRAVGPVGARPVLGWIGTPSTSRYLAPIESALSRVASGTPVSVRLVGSGRTPFNTLRADVREWSRETEAAEIAEFDIGLMPMPDTDWTRGKAALKALQYAASGGPTVASWTPTNEAILGVGQGTVFCRGEGEWIEQLGRLLADAPLRGEIGRRGRRLVEEKYSVQVQAPRLVQLIMQSATTTDEGRSQHHFAPLHRGRVAPRSASRNGIGADKRRGARGREGQ